MRMISLKKEVLWMLACSLPVNTVNPIVWDISSWRDIHQNILLLHEYTLCRRDIYRTDLHIESSIPRIMPREHRHET